MFNILIGNLASIVKLYVRKKTYSDVIFLRENGVLFCVKNAILAKPCKSPNSKKSMVFGYAVFEI
jgi:hypothetical protein